MKYEKCSESEALDEIEDVFCYARDRMARSKTD